MVVVVEYAVDVRVPWVEVNVEVLVAFEYWVDVMLAVIVVEASSVVDVETVNVGFGVT